MADDDKGKASSSSRRTMAPAAKDPAGVDDTPASVESADDGRSSYLDDMPDDELDELEAAVKRARLRRDRTPREPSFGLCEGEREELERTGKTVSPFTGELRGDWPTNARR